MVDEIKKSINSILYERAKSPLFGTLAVSWVIWNWRIFYITLFVDEKVIPNKLDFIHTYLYNKEHIIYYPLISTFFLLTIIPFINNGAFWLDAKFKNWRVIKKNEIEKKQLLTIEKSIELREQIKNQEDRFQKITSEKDHEIQILNLQIQELNKQSPENKEPKLTEEVIINDLLYKVRYHGYLKDFLDVGRLINKGEYISNDDPATDYFITLGLLKSTGSSKNNSKQYILTSEGNSLLVKARLEMDNG